MADLADKTEAPTLLRRAEARREGKLAISAELSAAVACLAAAVLLQQSLPGVVAALRTLMIEGLSAQPTTAGRVGGLVLRALAPLASGIVFAGVAVHVAQTRIWFGWKKETGVLNPIEGFRRICSGRSTFALLLNVIKLLIIALIAFTTLQSRFGTTIAALSTQPAEDLLSRGMSIVFAIAYRVLAALIVLGVIDCIYQHRRLEAELRMTRREVRDELRRQEGDPEIRRRRRSIWRSQAKKARPI